MIRSLVSEGRKQILLNMSEVTYADSSGHGELVSGFTTVSNAGGQLKLLNLTRRVKDLLQIQKTYTVFEVFEDEQRAVRSFSIGTLYANCPLCGYRAVRPLGDGAQWGRPPQTCANANCGAEFTIAESSSGVDVIRSARLRSYASEYFEALGGVPFRVRVVGRLNLFTSFALRKIWQALPQPRNVIVDLCSATELDAAGIEELGSLVKGDNAVVSRQGLAAPGAELLQSRTWAYDTDALCIRALGDLSKTPPWLAKFSQ
jgi:anti-sigma B factor antagonist